MNEETSMMNNIVEYNLNNNNKLYFSPFLNKFWINELEEILLPQYYDLSLSDLRIEITYACNGYCKYCIVYGNKIEKIESLNLKKVWSQIKNKSWFKHIETIFIIGGEPLLFFDQIEFLFEQFNGKIRISTNGTLITKAMAKKMAQYDVLIYLSLDGPDLRDNMLRVYNDGRYMYNDVLRGLNYLLDESVALGLFTVATKQNVNNIVEIVKIFVDKYHPKRIGYSLPHWTENNSDEVSAEEYGEALMKLFRHRRELDTEIMQLKWRLKPLWEGKIKKYACSMHTTQKTLLSNNTIVRCSKIDNDPVFSELSNCFFDYCSPLALASNRGNSCSECLALSCCGGGCPYDGLKRYGGAIDRRECEITPRIISEGIEEIVKAINRDHLESKNGIVSSEYIKSILRA